MSLPSQTARSIARRTFVYRRSRSRRSPRALVAAIALVIALLAAWWLWPDGKTTPAEVAPAPTAAAEPEAPRPGPPGLAFRETLTDEGDLPAAPDRGGPDGRQAPRPAPPAWQDERPTPAPPVALAGGDPEPDAGPPVAAAPPPSSPEEADPEPTILAAPAAMPREESAAEPEAPLDPVARRAVAWMSAGLAAMQRNEPVAAREMLSDALTSGALPATLTQSVRDHLARLNERLVFGPEVVEGDRYAFAYTIQSNDALSRLPRRLGLQTDWRLVQRINKIARPEQIRVGQRIKVVTGPFHAVVHKSVFRLDLYLGDETGAVFVRSFPVGLGEHNSTPEGRFRIREDSKLVNPEWVNPRTRERFLPLDPANPIGEHWLGLVGDEERLAGVEGYGIHGTIEPASIGGQSSMGCIRMLPDDVAIVWELLMPGVSVVEIRP